MKVLQKNQLPKLESSFHEVRDFISKYDQVKYFKDLWKDDYYKNIESTWETHIKIFKERGTTQKTWQELILVITFDYYLGPYVGLPENIKVEFYKWLMLQIENQLES